MTKQSAHPRFRFHPQRAWSAHSKVIIANASRNNASGSRLYSTTTYSTPEGTTLSRQHELKRLPVPKLQDTLSKYLKTVTQFLNKTEYDATMTKAIEFGSPGGVGEKLQSLLEDKASVKENWVSPFSSPFFTCTADHGPRFSSRTGGWTRRTSGTATP